MTFVPKFELCEPFDHSEYQGRIDRFQAELERRGLDGMLLFAVESHIYLYNYDQISAWFFQVLIVPRGKAPIAFVRHADQWLVQQSPFIKEVHTWRDVDEDPIKRMAQIMTDHGLAGKRIGIETTSSYLDAHSYDILKKYLSDIGITLVEASDIVGDMRLVKSPAEIEQIRKAGKVLDITAQAIFDAIKPGVRECDIYAEALHAMYAAGGDQSAGPIPIAAGINTLSFCHYSPTRRVIQEGEAVTFEIGGCVNHYHAVGLYSACAGKATSEMKGLYEEVRRTVDAGRAVLGPGVPVSKVAEAMTATLGAEAQKDWGIHFGYGTGIGACLTWHDRLRISRTSKYTLQPGNTMTLFSGRMCQNKYHVMSGDPVLITENGFEDFGQLSRGPFQSLG